MGTVLDFVEIGEAVKTARDRSQALRAARKAEKLSLTQAVCALEEKLGKRIAPKTLENWEGTHPLGIEPEEAAAAYKKFAQNAEHVRKLGKNLVFGTFPISIVKEILDFSDADIERAFGYSATYWSKIEANSRFISKGALKKVESILQDKFSEFCNPR